MSTLCTQYTIPQTTHIYSQKTLNLTFFIRFIVIHIWSKLKRSSLDLSGVHGAKIAGDLDNSILGLFLSLYDFLIPL